ncbi:MAG: hypothetical protein JW704_04270 [Anaerolineaceae bacterium]|nr:hypothetical protein [Anaerolineaceae bacterium]MBN2677494.1 hypothetical protein [Anaerolineaceae bacterium]
MNISPSEAEQALDVIQSMVKKTRRAVSTSGAYLFLIVWGTIWLIGFASSQFLADAVVGKIWAGLDILGAVLSAIIGIRMNRGVRSTSVSPLLGKRIGLFWLLLWVFCAAAIAVIWPPEPKQLAMIIILFVMTGWIAMGLLLSLMSASWGLAFTALALAAYFLLPDFFYIIMAILGGGGMIVLGLYIRSRW